MQLTDLQSSIRGSKVHLMKKWVGSKLNRKTLGQSESKCQNQKDGNVEFHSRPIELSGEVNFTILKQHFRLPMLESHYFQKWMTLTLVSKRIEMFVTWLQFPVHSSRNKERA